MDNLPHLSKEDLDRILLGYDKAKRGYEINVKYHGGDQKNVDELNKMAEYAIYRFYGGQEKYDKFH